MKQIAQTDQIKGRLRAAYGPDADLSGLAVFEIIALTTNPLRKANGIFKGARTSLSLLSELAASVNAESVPLQLVHDGEALPTGRFFYGEVKNDELRGLMAVDGANHPDIVTKLDNGTLDQVSVGFAPKQIKCSACGYDFLEPSNMIGLYTLTCDEDHVIGQDGVFAWVDGLNQFFELSLVGKGAAPGARVLGPSDAQLSHNEQFRLAASASPGLFCVALSPTLKDPETTMNAEQMAAFSAAISGQATATAQLGAVTVERDSARAELATRDTTITQLTAQVAELTQTAAEASTHKANHDAAVVALTAEATTVLTACGKPVDNLPKDVTGLLATITEHRAQFAAIVPPNGVAGSLETQKPVARTTAFRSPR